MNITCACRRSTRGRQRRNEHRRSGLASSRSPAWKCFSPTRNCSPTVMLTILVVLSVVKAAMIMSYFMHLKFEKFSLVLLLIPATIFCICMMFIFFFPEAFRLLQMRPH